jgi:hypothetical protein
VTDEPNRDHRCRTCEHWTGPLGPRPEGRWNCGCPLPFFASPISAVTWPDEGKDCAAYSYSYRRAEQNGDDN